MLDARSRVGVGAGSCCGVCNVGVMNVVDSLEGVGGRTEMEVAGGRKVLLLVDDKWMQLMCIVWMDEW